MLLDDEVEPDVEDELDEDDELGEAADVDEEEPSEGVLFGADPFSFDAGLVPADSLPLAPARESVR